jgi:hypothetical protein
MLYVCILLRLILNAIKVVYRYYKNYKYTIRVIGLLFSVYLFVINAIPCCNENFCNSQIKSEQSDHSDHSHNGDESDNHCNNCSPFFTCGSCAGFLVEIKGNVVRPSMMNNKKKVLPFYPGWQSDYFFKIWQPPKIS